MEDFVITIPIPKGEADYKLPDPDLLRYYRDYGDRICYVDSDIDDDTFEIAQRIFEYNRQDKGKKVEERKPIVIFVNSYGGELDVTYSIVSAILSSTTPVVTVNCGVAMSGGSLILLAGHKRYAMKYSTVMFHPGSAVQSGTYEQMRESQKNYERTVDIMEKYITERTKITSKKLKNNWTRDWYLNSSEQTAFGVVDKIVESLDEVF
jgi:Protease subunit of ATP-dependent Clp proteases